MKVTQAASGWAVGLIVLSLGCSQPTLAPEPHSSAMRTPSDTELEFSTTGVAADPASATGWAGFFPLEVGNRWSYEQVTEGWFIPTGGFPEPLFAKPFINRRDREITGTIDIRDHTYTVIHQVTTGEGFVSHWDYHYRQTSEGLFEVFALLAEPGSPVVPRTSRMVTAGAGTGTFPIRRELADRGLQASVDRLLARMAEVRRAALAPWSPSSVDHSEIEYFEATWLSYPLHPGKTWLLVDTHVGSPQYATVVQHARLELPGGDRSGWQVKLLGDVVGPQFEYVLWFGRDGYLGESLHTIVDAFDAEGNKIGTIEFVVNERLVDISLQGSLLALP